MPASQKTAWRGTPRPAAGAGRARGARPRDGHDRDRRRACSTSPPTGFMAETSHRACRRRAGLADPPRPRTGQRARSLDGGGQARRRIRGAARATTRWRTRRLSVSAPLASARRTVGRMPVTIRLMPSKLGCTPSPIARLRLPPPPAGRTDRGRAMLAGERRIERFEAAPVGGPEVGRRQHARHQHRDPLPFSSPTIASRLASVSAGSTPRSMSLAPNSTIARSGFAPHPLQASSPAAPGHRRWCRPTRRHRVPAP